MTFKEALFPPTERVLYERSPLAQVICQVRFPSILRIESQAPADFQDKIRHEFPLLERVAGVGGQQMPPEIAQMLGLQEGAISYNFKTDDDKYKVSLSGSFISLTCDDYIKWENFDHKLSIVIQAFAQVYKPSFYTRIGLRYVNVIDREGLNLKAVPWAELLRKELIGELSMSQWEDRTFEAWHNLRVLLSHDEGAMLLQHGLGKMPEGENLSYVIDFDFYKDKRTEVGDVAAVLEKFHDRSGRAFAWCITDRLREALGPKQPDH